MKRSIFDMLSKDNTGEILQVDIHSVRPSRYQPRISFDEQAMEELTASIKENGLIQPITVRKVEDGYEIIAGERRFRACQRAGYETIPCYVLSPGEDEAAGMALIENIQREDLTAVEEARSYVHLMRQASLTQEELAARLGKSQSGIANKIRLLNLPLTIQEAVINKTISERHARALLSVPEEKRMDAYRYVTEKKLTVRQTDAYVERLVSGRKKRRNRSKGFTRNIQIGLNTVHECVRRIKQIGIDVLSETEETDEDVRVIIRFPKS
ncbi:MAG: ParB/RepB/Spo0J family partition protein [Solobacterium sp.]|nr:ParB/RepB/Spo0J family partition protein [Solobacterium sp.]MBQ6592449.1 ParB/RepB/Spo0J family partition protein [Solobacterium sp.]MBR0478677.1 ParB/RepB/Spo0J family partition protein [Solobacterium sp.]MCR5373581.1 ParB/RepB/Spo0J family partition protein [Solobacterium sp.]